MRFTKPLIQFFYETPFLKIDGGAQRVDIDAVGLRLTLIEPVQGFGYVPIQGVAKIDINEGDQRAGARLEKIRIHLQRYRCSFSRSFIFAALDEVLKKP